MNPGKLIQWAGLLAIADGILLLLWWMLLGTLMPGVPAAGEPFDMVGMVRHENWLAVNVIGSIATMLLPVALVGFYLKQFKQTKMFGLVGLVMSFLGLQLFVWIQVDETILWPLLAVHAPTLVDLQGPMFSNPAFNFTYILMGVLFIPGAILFGIAMLKAQVLPKWGVWMFTVGAPLFGIGGPVIVVRTIGIVLLSSSLIWLGRALWSDQGGSTGQNT